jgi:hypothetical protein
MTGSWEIIEDVSKAIPYFRGILISSFWIGIFIIALTAAFWEGKEVY